MLNVECYRRKTVNGKSTKSEDSREKSSSAVNGFYPNILEVHPGVDCGNRTGIGIKVSQSGTSRY